MRKLGSPLLVSVVLALAVTGCGGDDPADETVAESTTSPTTSPNTTTEIPSPTPTATPTPTQSNTASPPRSRIPLEQRLLAAALVPGFNEEFKWRDLDTVRDEGESLAGMCQRFSLTSIGATKAVRRDYAPAEGSTGRASEVVAQFPDAKTANSAYSVVRSWHENCPVDHDGDPDVGEFSEVGLTEATGGWYLLTYGETFRAQGVAVRGDRMATVVLTTEGQDYNYEPGKEPMVEALSKAAALL